mmetsp:Transcript_4310/g.11799  ORF Transcript_4310/g.11799 Transcript_4310/m.11799 type:complete len:613 (-) Transcript_4310:75-1913(-)
MTPFFFFGSHNRWAFVVLSFLWLGPRNGGNLVQADTSTVRTLSIGGSFSVNYVAEVAAFGDPLEGPARTYNLMLPPDDPWLCQFPEAYVPLVNNHTAVVVAAASESSSSSQLPVALFISINRCSAEQKARVAQEIQQRVSHRLKLLVVYSPDPRAISLMRLQPDGSSGSTGIGQDLGIVHVPYRYAAGIDTRMRMAWSGRDPRFLVDDNEYWSFPITLSNYTTDDDDKWTLDDDDDGPEIFPWFRVLLFTILVCSPCCRACYLWYASGGRFYLRRNEEGHIIGLQYVPPAPTWLNRHNAAAGEHGGRPARSDVLTEEQFQALPEIEYKTVASHYDEDNEEEEQQGDADDGAEQDIVVEPAAAKDSPSVDVEEAPFQENDVAAESNVEDAPFQKDLSIAYGEQDTRDAANEKDNNTFAVEGTTTTSDNDAGKKKDPPSAKDAAEPDLESGTEVSEPDGATDDRPCRSTMCSICIDEFEPGETLILLPRCRHAFHKECLHPWLTERQGCCPFCKTPVLEEASDTEGEDEESQPTNNTATAEEGQSAETPRNNNSAEGEEGESEDAPSRVENNVTEGPSNNDPPTTGSNVNFNSLQLLGAPANSSSSNDEPTRTS